MYFYDYPIIGKESQLPLFLISVGLNEWQYHVVCREGDSYHKALYCTKGCGTLILNEKEHIIKPYTAFFIPAGCPHEYYTNGDAWDTHWVIPGGNACEEMLKAMGFDVPVIFPIQQEEIKYLDHCFRRMHESVIGDRVHGNFRASGYLYSFLIEFSRIANKGDGNLPTNPVVTRALDFIDANYMKKLDLNAVSQAAQVSTQHLCRLFRTTLNCRPMEYIAKRRIQAAKELLLKSDKSTELIAEETGFCDSSYFCKLFKRYEGITPSQFRNLN